MYRGCPTVVMVLLLATMAAWAEEPLAEGERFAFGMTVSFPGSQSLQFRLLSEPLPDLEQGGPVTELKLGPPLDLWVLGMDGNRLDAPEARLVNPNGEVVEPGPSGHWRVNRPEIGYYELTVPPVGRQWRLWSAFHPFMLRLDEPVTVVVGDEPGAVFLHPSGAKLELTDPGEVVIGDDRIVTCASGTFTLGRDDPLTAYIYAGPTGELQAEVAANASVGGHVAAELTLSDDQIAVIVQSAPECREE